MYADDTSLAQSANDIKDMANVMNYELDNVKEWLHGNKLSLNVAKTTSMLIGTRHILHDKITAEPLRANFEISGEPIEQKISVKYLGVQIDNDLKWKDPYRGSVIESDSSYRNDKIFQEIHPKICIKDILSEACGTSF